MSKKIFPFIASTILFTLGACGGSGNSILKKCESLYTKDEAVLKVFERVSISPDDFCPCMTAHFDDYLSNNEEGFDEEDRDSLNEVFSALISYKKENDISFYDAKDRLGEDIYNDKEFSFTANDYDLVLSMFGFTLRELEGGEQCSLRPA